VIYEPGELKAVAYRDGEKIGEALVRTAARPSAVRLTPEWTEARADGNDLWYVLVEAVDQQGTVCPLADNLVIFQVEGPATIAGIGNGDQRGLDSFTDNEHPLFYGKTMLILRSVADHPGRVTVRATSNGLQIADTEVTAQR